MNQRREFMSETFHLLAQPITALRFAVELGLSKAKAGADSEPILENCLQLIDRLMQDLAVFREISSLDEPPALQFSDGRELLAQSVEEMAPVAQDKGVALQLDAEPAGIQCHESMLQRALFVLLDELIASTPGGGQISISLRRSGDGFLLKSSPGMPPGQRQKLCGRLLQFAGGSGIRFASGSTSITFRGSSYRHLSELPLTDKQLLTLHESSSRNGAIRDIS
jgi:signal transduction histidine kinase